MIRLRRIRQSVLTYLTSHRWCWALLRRILVIPGHTLMRERQRIVSKTPAIDIAEAAYQLSPNGIVRNGPLAGLRYPQMESAGSALFPKLLGSYERELHDWVLAGDGRQYAAIVDVGCAEGYYAVGLAKRWPQVTVYAYDTASRARQLCLELAAANNVADRVMVGGACTASTLSTLDLPGRALIISDCEGFEAVLFTPKLIDQLKRHDILIELHDWYDIRISVELKQRFAASHDIESRFSIDDLQKVHRYRDYPELDRWDLYARRTLLSEQRPYVMEWIYCRSRLSDSPAARS